MSGGKGQDTQVGLRSRGQQGSPGTLPPWAPVTEHAARPEGLCAGRGPTVPPLTTTESLWVKSTTTGSRDSQVRSTISSPAAKESTLTIVRQEVKAHAELHGRGYKQRRTVANKSPSGTDYKGHQDQAPLCRGDSQRMPFRNLLSMVLGRATLWNRHLLPSRGSWGQPVPTDPKSHLAQHPH